MPRILIHASQRPASAELCAAADAIRPMVPILSTMVKEASQMIKDHRSWLAN